MTQISILVVEDEAITALDIKNTLQKLGYYVPAIETSGEEAIAGIKKFKPDLVLMDIVLKGKMNGIVAAQKILNMYHIPVVFVTAYGDQDTFNLAKLSMPYGYLVKPFESNDLRIAVDLALFKHQMETALADEIQHIRSELLASISHELRTPLNSIIGFAELINTEKSGQLPTEYKKYMQHILSSSHQLLRLINDILDLARTESKEIHLYPSAIELTKLIEEIQDEIFNVTEHKIELDVQIDPSLYEIMTDSKKLKKILFHLIINTFKYSSTKGPIIIAAHPINKTYFRIDIQTESAGINKENLKKIFTPFQQLNGSSTKKYLGTGLGLALAYILVHALGGEIGVQTSSEKGSNFFVVLPITPPQHAGPGVILEESAV